MTPICNLFEQTSSHACLNLSKCENVGSELNISNIKVGFMADKHSSVIFNSTGYLVEADEAITVYKLEKFIDGCDVSLTDEERMSVKAVKKIQTIEKKL